jgi:hypothetical protein
MIKVVLHGRMGNQLFQFAFGHILAKKNKTILLVEVDKHKFYLNGFKLPFPYNLFSKPLLYRLYNQLSSRLKFKNKVELLDLKKRIELTKNTNNTVYNGYFQDASFFEPYIKDIQQLFSIKPFIKKQFDKKYGDLFLNRKTLVISMRLGEDYQRFILPDLNNATVFLPINWYNNVLQKIQYEYESIFIISDEMNEAKKILGVNEKFIFVEDTPEIQIQLLMNADACIIANSSFSWWGAFLNRKVNKKIYAPVYWAGYNAKIEYPAGIMAKDFIWV